MMSDRKTTSPAAGAIPAVRLTGICKRFGSTAVLDDVTLDIARGEATVLIGASGSGKTSLLRCLIGLLDPDSGTIDIDGERVIEQKADRRSHLTTNSTLR